MQDSIEDYVQFSRNGENGEKDHQDVKDKVGKVKPEVLVTVQIKKECEARAMQIIQFAIEGRMRSDALFKCLPYINPSHYQDIVEERAITKLCGYPLCSKRISEMPKKQFHISVKNNKIYDITDRKNYCSNYCYRASIHIKNQIDSSPLWSRNHAEIKRFTLLDKLEKGIPGKEIDQGVSRPGIEDDLFTSVSAFAQMSLDETNRNLNVQGVSKK